MCRRMEGRECGRDVGETGKLPSDANSVAKSLGDILQKLHVEKNQAGYTNEMK